MNNKWKEVFSIPNCMSFFRLLLIPVFCVAYLKADKPADYYAAAGIVLLSALTDFFDGKIARKFHMITDFGKFLDPVADKLTHGALVLCLAFRYPSMKYLLIILLLKELFMLVIGVINLRHGSKLEGAKIFGKICTATQFVLYGLLILYYTINVNTANVLIAIETLILLVTWGLYIPVFVKMKKTWKY